MLVLDLIMNECGLVRWRVNYCVPSLKMCIDNISLFIHNKTDKRKRRYIILLVTKIITIIAGHRKLNEYERQF